MADHQKEEGIVDDVADKIDRSDLSSDEKESSIKAKVYRLFGKEVPVPRVLSGGKPADLFLWKDKKVSGTVLGVATAIWVLFDVVEYQLLTLLSHVLIFGLAVSFLWSNAKSFFNKSPPHIPEVAIPEDIVLESASALRIEINHGFAALRDIASGRDAKKFFSVISSLWALSTIGTWCSFLTLLYIITVVLFTVPLFYEKYGEKINSFAEDVKSELKNQYDVFHGRVLTRVPHRTLKGKYE